MPKKKAGKKGAKIIDGVATNEMTREQLMSHVKRMQVELNREREERNFFMLEREKLYALWNITLEQLAAEKGEARLADVRMDDNEKEREEEMHVYKQKLRFLMTEQSRRVAEVRLHNLNKMKVLQESTWKVQNSMRQTIDKKNREISNCQTSIQSIMRQLQTEHEESCSKLRNDFCAELRRIESTFERLMFEREKSQQLHEASEIQRTNQEKSEHVRQLMELHQIQLEQMKEYFNEITANNFAVISALQENIGELRGREQELKQKLSKERTKCRKLEEKIIQDKKEMEKQLQEDRKCAQEIRRQLRQRDKRLKLNEEYARALEVNNEVLVQKTELVKKDRDSIKGTFVKTIIDMQKKANMNKLILEMKLNALSQQKSQSPNPNIHPSPNYGDSSSASSTMSKHSESDTNNKGESKSSQVIDGSGNLDAEVKSDSSKKALAYDQ